MLPEEVSVEVRDETLRRRATIAPAYLDLKAVRRHLGIGTWTLRLPVEHEASSWLAQPGSGILVHVRDTQFISGPMTDPSRKRSQDDPTGLQTFSGVSDETILWDAVALPDPANLPDAQTLSHDVRTGPAETVLKAYVNVNVGPGALLSRRGTFGQALTIEADGATGLSVARSARFDSLGDLLRDIAVYARMGFRVAQVGNGLVFQTYAIADRRKFVRFDIDNGTLESEEIRTKAPKLTRAYVLGQGDGAARQVVARSSVASTAAEAAWGRVIEFVKDQRQTSDTTELEQAGDTALAKDGFARTAIKAIPSDESTMMYATDWGLGDDVVVVIDGQQVDSQITEAALVVNSRAAMIGAAIGDVTGFDPEAAIEERVRETERRVAALERLINAG